MSVLNRAVQRQSGSDLDENLGGEAALFLASPAERPIHLWVRPYGLTERQIGFYSRLVRFVHPRHFAEVPFAFRVFGGKQMTPGRLGAQNFAASGDLEPLRDCFASFAAGNWLRHEARKIVAAEAITNSFCFLSQDRRAAKFQIPTTKLQRNSTSQIPKGKTDHVSLFGY